MTNLTTTKLKTETQDHPPGGPGKRRPRTRAQRHQELDELCKQAMQTDRARLLEVVLTPAVRRRLELSAGPVELLEILPTEMRRKRVYTDYLIRVKIGEREVLLHVEFQNQADPRMAVRIIQYQVAAVALHELPVYSVVFNVHGGGAQAVVVQGAKWGRLKTDWVEVRVARAVKRWGQVASPLAVVLATLLGELSDAELSQCLVRLRELGLDEETCRDLVEAVCFLADVKKKGPPEETRKRLFMKMRINQTWLFQEGRQEGREEGVLEGRKEGVLEGRKEGVLEGRKEGIQEERANTLKTLQQTVVELWQQRFGAPPDASSLARLRRVHEPGFLSRLLLQLAQAASLTEARSILHAS